MRPPLVRPLAPERYHVSFTANAETIAKLRAAQDLLGHAIPSGEVAQVIDRALTLLVADLTRRKAAATRRPQPAKKRTEDCRSIAAAVRRVVWKRDGGGCAFVASDGHRCGTSRRLEFHHVRPFAESGKGTVANIELRCAAHNRHEADVFYAASRETREYEGSTAPADGGGGRWRTRPGPSGRDAGGGARATGQSRS
jgi:hypothetical protein